MNVEVRPIKTAAETALAANFAMVEARAAGRGGGRGAARAGFPALRDRRPAAPARRGMEIHRPARAHARRQAARGRARRGREGARQAGRSPRSLRSRRAAIVFVDGAFVPELSDLADLEAGLTIGSMAQRLAAGDPQLVAHLGKLVPTDDVAVALNTAFMGDGAVIHVAEGVALARPIHLVFVECRQGARRRYSSARLS